MLILIQLIKLFLEPKLKKLLLKVANKKSVIEIGSPSNNFRYVLPIYKYVQKVDILSLEGNFAGFKDRSLNNFKKRGRHNHAFDINIMKEMSDFFSIEVLYSSENKID